MIILLIGDPGSGKTTIANALESYWKDSFVIDGDELREETKNFDYSEIGRRKNIELGLSRARRLSDLGFTVFVAMQAPYKDLREKFLQKYDKVIKVFNTGENPKLHLKNVNIDYSNIDGEIDLQEFSVKLFNEKYIPKVLVPARFQGFHKGHKVVLEEAKRISPDITVALRVDEGDVINLDDNIQLLKDKGWNVIKTPNIDEDWTYLSDEYDYLVQGNPTVIKKFDLDKIELVFIPRYGSVSGTKIRNDLNGNKNNIDRDVKELLEKMLEESYAINGDE